MKKFSKILILFVTASMTLNSAFAGSSNEGPDSPGYCSVMFSVASFFGALGIEGTLENKAAHGLLPGQVQGSEDFMSHNDYSRWVDDKGNTITRAAADLKYGPKTMARAEKLFKNSALRPLLIFTGLTGASIAACNAVVNHSNARISRERAKSFVEAPTVSAVPSMDAAPDYQKAAATAKSGDLGRFF